MSSKLGIYSQAAGGDVFDPLTMNWDIYYDSDNVILSGSSVSSFVDLSSNSNNSTQATTANQGTLIATDVSYNNLSTVEVTGTDFYDLTNNLTINRNGNRTIWWMGNNIVTASTFEFLYSTTSFSFIGYVRAAGGINFVGNGSQWANVTATNVTAPLINTITFTANGKMRFYQNGVLINVSTADLNVSGAFTADRMFGTKTGSALNAKFHQFSSVERLLTINELNYLGDGFSQQLGTTWTPIV